ncbi:MAG: DUF1592 domain-containing protein [Verrucomicrobia bacterium]|nr:DUF1592 domain-containing protein [Verrucomicrobiota bacterium]MDA1067891.1 DUF1592 domain-containing protein [Verrucomicrobiota bacterium]
MVKRFAVVLIASLPVVAAAVADSHFDASLTAFVNDYCVKCHGPEKQKGVRRFDTLSLPVSDSETLIQLQDMLDILNLGEMPPEDEDERPEVDGLLQMIGMLTDTIETHNELLASTGQKTLLRRLNSREYRNTIRDLFNMNTSLFDPTQSFPPDETVQHLDTLGDQLVTSGYLLDQYFEAADEVIEKVFSVRSKPVAREWTFKNNFRNLMGLDTVMEKLCNYEYMMLLDLPSSIQNIGAYGTIYDFLNGVPFDGYYRIRVQAESKNRKHSYVRPITSTNPNQPHELGIVPGNILVGDIGMPQHIEPVLASFTLPDDQVEWYEATVWLDAGITPRFIFPNGTVNARSANRATFARIAPTLDEELENDFQNRRYITLKYGNLPHIRIHEVEITGPLYDSWPPPPQKTVLQGDRFNPGKVGELIAGFATRAYRRPATKEEVGELLTFYEHRRADGIPRFRAFKETLKRVLCSPGFLYLHEPSDDQGRLTGYALASRLSYFLWSSMPDEELLALASQDHLSDPEILQQQVRRMLADPKALSLVKNFVDLVLTLKDLGTQPPDDREFRLYYERNLQKYMYEETLYFVQHLFEENRAITDLIDADYSFINEPLAELYGYQDIHGLDFRKAQIQDPLRRGILGHASILTVTANGIDTSPVIRGVWILENILGTPPSPPPPDVEPFDPDTRGAVSLRDQLEKHRKNPTCYECHRKIDPLGFAFESFDPIGQLRSAYPNDLPVDSSGTLPDGTSFQTVAELKHILLERQPQIARSLTSKLLAFAAGRRMEAADRREMERIVELHQEKGNGFRDLFELVALSEILQKK